MTPDERMKYHADRGSRLFEGSIAVDVLIVAADYVDANSHMEGALREEVSIVMEAGAGNLVEVQRGGAIMSYREDAFCYGLSPDITGGEMLRIVNTRLTTDVERERVGGQTTLDLKAFVLPKNPYAEAARDMRAHAKDEGAGNE
jgi:hypothetical protein